jgi:hypothetical protein
MYTKINLILELEKLSQMMNSSFKDQTNLKACTETPLIASLPFWLSNNRAHLNAPSDGGVGASGTPFLVLGVKEMWLVTDPVLWSETHHTWSKSGLTFC